MSDSPHPHAPEPSPGFRIVARTYSGDATPLVEVLLMLHDWSVERAARLREKQEATSRCPSHGEDAEG